MNATSRSLTTVVDIYGQFSSSRSTYWDKEKKKWLPSIARLDSLQV